MTRRLGIDIKFIKIKLLSDMTINKSKWHDMFLQHLSSLPAVHVVTGVVLLWCGIVLGLLDFGRCTSC